MDYTISELSKLAGVSTRTLRYYDEIGLLKPSGVRPSGYRIYGQREVELLQQILLYRELEMPLSDIKDIIADSDFDFRRALLSHQSELKARKRHIDALLYNVEKTLKDLEGERKMSNKERFNEFAEKAIKENEEKYGKEIREKYGDDVVDASNERLRKMTGDEWKASEKLGVDVNSALAGAMDTGDPASKEAQDAIKLHREWLSHFGDYSDEAYLGLTQMYVNDPRFTAYYDAVRPGLAVFLRGAAKISVGK
ncbi:MAG: MerR family transcriptional regulator [Bacillota bacterium]|nr:MerR family transcriptional regulator [Bacillota bacterium]